MKSSTSENTKQLLLSLDAATGASIADLPNLSRAQNSTEVAEKHLEESAVSRDVSRGAFAQDVDLDAVCNQANLLHKGAKGMEPDITRAVELYERAVDGDDAPAMKKFANLLEEGANGVDVDRARAVDLYLLAIDKAGDNQAMRNLAFLLQEGADGGDADHVEAVKRFKHCVKLGRVAEALSQLASILVEGGKKV